MDVLVALKERRSIRKYQDKEVPLDMIGAVVQAGQMAPSSGDQQSWKFIVIQNEEARKALAEVSLEQYWMSKAPVHIVVVAEENKVSRLYGLRGEKLYSVQNCAAAIQNMLLSAEELGLGACWVGAFDEHRVGSICNVPSSSRVQAIITLGYPDEKPKEKIIQPLERVMYLESYGGKIGDLSPFIWDWSSVVEKEVKTAKKDISEILKESLADHREKLKSKIDKLKKKLDSKIQRPKNQ